MTAMGDNCKVYFVKCDKNGENESGLVEAFELLQKGEQNLEMQWISQEDCLSIEIKGKPSHNIFIFNTFEGQAFQNVKNLKCRIYGPQCLVANLQHNINFPKDTKHPIFNMAMRGVKICCTSMEKNTRNEIEKLMHLMAGETVKDLTSDITHLIAGEVGSVKYMVAQKTGKTIMTKEWVYKVWESAQFKHILGTDEIFQNCKCPLFLGLTVCVSGFNHAERNQMKNFVTKGGGKYSGELKMNECTHLIVKEPKGAKYEAARNWKIRIVRDRWLFDCVDKGKYLDPQSYQFVKEVKTSTPERLSIAGPSISDVSAISVVDSRDMTSQQVDDTDLLSSRMSMLSHNRTSVGEIRQEVTCVEMNSTVAPVDIFLDGCRIFFSGVELSLQEKMKKIITSCGGFRTTELESGVTHVIVGKQIQADVIAANKLADRPHLLRSDWLMDCFHKNTHLDEKGYLVNCLDNEELHTSGSSKSTTRSETGSNETLKEKNEFSLPQGEEAPSDLQMAELLSQYVPLDNEKAAEDRTLVGKEVEAKGIREEDTCGGAAPPEDGMTQDPNDVTDHLEDRNGIFNNKVFILLGLQEEAKEEFASHIESRGGRLINLNQTRRIADISIVPLKGYQVNVTEPQVLTVIWLQMCLERDELVPVSHWLARPIEVPDGEPLSGCCISVSGFSGVEKESMVHLVEFLGANYENNFSRRTTKKVKACTHLIVCMPEGSKYTAAKQWGIPAVGKEWLKACIESGRKPPEEEFDVDITSKNHMEKEDKADSPAPAQNSPIKLAPQEPQASSPTVDDRAVDAQEQAVNAEGCDMMDMGNRTTIGERSMCITPCPGQQGEKVQSSSTENSQRSSGTDLNPLRDVNRYLKVADVNTPRLSPKILEHKLERRRTADVETLPPGLLTTPTNARIKELVLQDANSSLSSTPLGLVKGGGETPGTFFQPGYKAKLNSSGLFSPMTPANVRELNKSTHIGEVFTRQFEKVADTVVDCKELTPSQSQPECVAPLYGVVIAVARKLGRNQVEYNGLVVELGGDYTWQYNDTVTHYVFQGRPNDTNKEFRKAREAGTCIVSPHWLYMCKEQSCRVDESLFPHHYNPSQALAVATDKETPLRSKRNVTRSKGSKSETPLKSSKGKTPGRMRPVLDMQSLTSKDMSPVKILRKECADEGLEKHGDKITEHVDSRTEEKSDSKDEKPSHLSTAAVSHVGEVTITPPSISHQEEVNVVSEQASSSTKLVDEMSKEQEEQKSLSKTLETVLAEASSRSRKSSRKKGKRLNLGVQRNSSSGNTPESTLTRSNATGWSSKESKDSNILPEPSQSVQVMWDDPTERLEKEKLAHRLERVCDPSQNSDDYLGAMELHDHRATKDDVHNNDAESKSRDMTSSKETYRSPTPEAPSIAFPVAKPASKVMSPQPVELLSDESCDSRMGHTGGLVRNVPVFSMSGMQTQEKVDYGALVEELGGRVSEKPHIDPSCTHLVAAQPVRNEKFLSSVAAGNWVLHKSYFEACRKEGRLVKEESHEWGSDYTLSLMQNMTPQAVKLALAAHKWRKKIASIRKSNPTCRGAFYGWNVMLCLDAYKEQNFQRILEAGGATVSIIRPPFSQSLKATHAFLDLAKVKLSEENLETLICLDIHCLKAEYIAAYLTSDAQPDPSDFYPTEVVALKACMPADKRSRKRKAGFDKCDSNIKQKERETIRAFKLVPEIMKDHKAYT